MTYVKTDSRRANRDFRLWVIGQGLIGSAIARRHGRVFEAPGFEWQSTELPEQIISATRQFAAHLSADDAFNDEDAELTLESDAGPSRWAIVWSAGRGVVGSSEKEMAQETAALAHLIESLHVARPHGDGALLMVSSAGAIYANSQNPPFDEETPVDPKTNYGLAKQEQESLVRAAAKTLGVRSLVVRAANVYGVGQDMKKSQGLISHLCRTAVSRQPTNLYVSADTMRHYIWSEDLAEATLKVIERSFEHEAPFELTKVASSATSTTVGELVSLIQRISKVPMRVGLGTEPRAFEQARDVRLRSKVWQQIDDSFQMPLAAGIKEVLDGFRFPEAIR